MSQSSSKIGGGLLVAVLLAGSYTFSVLNPGGGGAQQPASDTSTPAVYVPPATRTPTPTSSTAPGTAATPCSNCGGGGSLPHHMLAGYWHNFTNGSTALRGWFASRPGRVGFARDNICRREWIYSTISRK